MLEKVKRTSIMKMVYSKRNKQRKKCYLRIKRDKFSYCINVARIEYVEKHNSIKKSIIALK